MPRRRHEFVVFTVGARQIVCRHAIGCDRATREQDVNGGEVVAVSRHAGAHGVAHRDGIARSRTARRDRHAVRRLVVGEVVGVGHTRSISPADRDGPQGDGPSIGRRDLDDVVRTDVARRDADRVIADRRRIVTYSRGGRDRRGTVRSVADHGHGDGIARHDAADVELHAVRLAVVDDGSAVEILKRTRRAFRVIHGIRTDGQFLPRDGPSVRFTRRDHVVGASRYVQGDLCGVGTGVGRRMCVSGIVDVSEVHARRVGGIDLARRFGTRDAVLGKFSGSAARGAVVGVVAARPSDRNTLLGDLPRSGSQAAAREIIVDCRRGSDAHRGGVGADVLSLAAGQTADGSGEGVLRENAVARDYVGEGGRRAVLFRRVIDEVADRPIAHRQRHLVDRKGLTRRGEGITHAVAVVCHIARGKGSGVGARVLLDVVTEERRRHRDGSSPPRYAVSRDGIAVRSLGVACRAAVRPCRRRSSSKRPVVPVVSPRKDRRRRGRAVAHRPNVGVDRLLGDRDVLLEGETRYFVVCKQTAVGAVCKHEAEGGLDGEVGTDEHHLRSLKGGGGSADRVFKGDLGTDETVLHAPGETACGQGIGKGLRSDQTAEDDLVSLIDVGTGVDVGGGIVRSVVIAPRERRDRRVAAAEVVRLLIAEGYGRLCNAPRR